jgi:hypothetical protein
MGDLQLLIESGTHRPLTPLTVQTSCFKLVFATQQAPSGTGRLALAPWGMAVARAERARTTAEMVNFILAVELFCCLGY